LFEGLRELGYVEGQNLIVERRYAEGHAERFQDFAAEMVRLKADIIIVVTTPAALAVKNATTTIPIVHPNAIDPVESGLVTSLAHPGGNVTGLAVVNAELSAKRVEIFKQLLPRLARAAVLWNVATQVTRSLGETPNMRLVFWGWTLSLTSYETLETSMAFLPQSLKSVPTDSWSYRTL
jgi:ABC-type uncharacterized transport system substrate-binding protein